MSHSPHSNPNDGQSIALSTALDPCKMGLATDVTRHLATLATETGGSFTLSPQAVFLLIEKPPEASMGDYSLPCFRFAKDLKRPPQAVGEWLSAAFNRETSAWIESTSVLKAFLNFKVHQTQMAKASIPSLLQGGFFSVLKNSNAAAEKVMVEYSQPNTHKEFHVGHMRNVCLGAALINLNRFCGNEVTAVNYLGDEGAHIAKCLWMMKRKGERPKDSEDKGAWLGLAYVEAVKALDGASSDELTVFEQEISAVLKGIESKSGPWYDLWAETRQWSLDGFKKVYDWIGASFDRDFFESEVSSESQSIVGEFLKKGVFKEDDGAVGVDLSEYKLGFMLVRKRDGNTLYATKDLVLARRKFLEFKIDRNIYVVANEQNHHFKQVFKTLELMGFKQASRCYHLSYGMVVLPEGKMSSRAGTSVPFMTLKDTMMVKIKSILEKYQGVWPAEEIDATAKKLCVGAIKYGMLQADPSRDIVFDINEWISFEGNTGPYLMYAYSRAQSVLGKASEAGHKPWDHAEFVTKAALAFEPTEAELLRSIYDFNTVVLDACKQNRPSHLASHLYSMCKNFSRFYADVPILKAADPETIRMRLTLILCFKVTLKHGLSLLGITPPERM